MTHLQSAGRALDLYETLSHKSQQLLAESGGCDAKGNARERWTIGACHIHPQPICLDLGASWHVETWVFRLDVCMIPGSDITLHDLRQDAGRKFQAL